MSMDQIPFGESAEFAVNSEPRCPCLLLLDTSGSMKGKPIDELNAGIRQFKDELLADEMAQKELRLLSLALDQSKSYLTFRLQIFLNLQLLSQKATLP